MKVLVPFYPLYVPTPREDYFAVDAGAAGGAQIINIEKHSFLELLRMVRGEKVHAHGRGHFFPEWTSLVAGPTVYDFHNNYIGQKGYARLIRRWLLNRCVRVIVHSPFAQKNYIAQGIAPDKLVVLPHPIDVDYFAAPAHPERFREKHGLGTEPYAMCVGIRRHKNPWVMIDACRRVGIRLVMVGFKNAQDIHQWSREFLPEERLAELKDDRVRLTGYLSTEDLRDAYQGAAVYLNSSEADGEVFCLAVHEAAAAGIPLCLPDYGTFESFTDAALFHRNTDSAALAKNIQRLLDDAGLRARLTGRAWIVVKTCNYPNVLEQYRNLYRDIGFL